MPPRLAFRSFVPIALAALLAACSSAPRRSKRTPPPRHGTAHTQLANAVLFRAIALIGTPYHFGGNTPLGGFDCSGLVAYVFRDAAGVALPRTSRQMSELDVPTIDRDDLQAGDLVFFRGGRAISHVGIYVGKHRFVDAPNSGGTVRLDEIDGPWWREHFAYGKRVL